MSARTPELIFREYLAALGVDPDADPELAATPERFTELLRDRFRPDNALPDLRALASEVSGDELVIVRGLRFHSLCVHHVTPFFGTVAIGFVPDGRIVGFGALDRLVTEAARRPQLQERFVEQIAAHIERELAPLGLVVACRARQMCMELTGTQAGAETIAVCSRGSLSGERGHQLGLSLVE